MSTLARIFGSVQSAELGMLCRSPPLKPMLAVALQIVVERDARVARRLKGAEPQVVYIYE